MSDDDQPIVSLRLLVAGLVCAIVANVLVIWLLIDMGSFAFAGNVATIFICIGAIYLIRIRRNMR